jgi:hypothetical protein
MSEISKFIWLISNEDEIIIKQFLDFIFICYQLRNNTVNLCQRHNKFQVPAFNIKMLIYRGFRPVIFTVVADR